MIDLKVLLIFSLGCMTVTGLRFSYDIYKYEEGQRYMMMPDKDGKMHLVDFQQEGPERKYDAVKSVRFYLYTLENMITKEEIVFKDEKSLKDSSFNIQKPVKVIAHGWNNNGDSPVNTLLTEAFMKIPDVNVLVVDWRVGGNSLYTTSAKNAVLVGIHVANMIDWLIDMGSKPSLFHLMGHSLGAHAMGVAARNIDSGVIPYLTGMDPANPLWGSSSERIRPTDAKYVEIIHTDAGGLGLKDQVGDADFYPNKGSSQPMCWLMSCSHSMSYQYMAESIDHKGYMAAECTDYKEMSKGNCANLSYVHMGGAKPKSVSGIYYLKTNKKKPYYMD